MTPTSLWASRWEARDGKIEAVAAFREAIRLNPELIDAQDNVRIARGRDLALAAFREAIRNVPRPVAASGKRGQKGREQREAADRAADRNGGLRLDPESAGHIERGLRLDLQEGVTTKRSPNSTKRSDSSPGCLGCLHPPRLSPGRSKREYGKAIADYDKAVVLDPQNAAAYNDRAWLRATCPVAEYRDGNKALESAIWACALSGWKNAHPLGTLAAAYAEASDFASAVKCQTKAITPARG